MIKETKNNYQTQSYINNDVKVNDVVYFRDGSSFSFKDKEENNPTHIVQKGTAFGLESVITSIPFRVKETKISNVVVIYYGSFYQTDCLVEFNGIEVYTCSKFLNRLT